ncbi:pentapeptide repeat-containing protein [Labrenzia sp. OB1]|uniref:pentapeptide repeat-containing protein n=1 Tax=Labrenzia sp. OB1 TaxID=1561204 RepID=UPI0007B20E61|nr:pentapeptide repeat-containing protein [Labrenzia sp. OB1]KZM48260.1 hypothetical protein OA90_21110 [Labrenzia sp. OB1]
MHEDGKTRLADLSARLDEARARQAARPAPEASFRNRSARKSLASSWRLTKRGYAGTNSVLEAIEKSPIVRLVIALVFLMTATAVLFDLYDRNTQIEIAAWDLFEKTKPGTPQRTRAVNLLASTGAPLDRIDFGLKRPGSHLEDAIDMHSNYAERYVVLEEMFYENRLEYCLSENGTMRGVDFSANTVVKVFQFGIFSDPTTAEGGKLNCLFIDGTFEEAILHNAEFIFSEIQATTFAQAALFDARFDAAFLDKVSFLGASLQSSSFRASYLVETVFNDADLLWSSFEGASLYKVDFTGARLQDVNFSNAAFCEDDIEICGENKISQKQLDMAWAWADRPPIGLEKLDPPLKIGFLCNPALRLPATQLAPEQIEEPKQIRMVPKECSWRTRRTDRNAN